MFAVICTRAHETFTREAERVRKKYLAYPSPRLPSAVLMGSREFPESSASCFHNYMPTQLILVGEVQFEFSLIREINDVVFHLGTDVVKMFAEYFHNLLFRVRPSVGTTKDPF